MAIAFVATAQASGTGTSLVVNKPTGTVDGHSIEVGINHQGATTATITPPDGSWTMVGSPNSYDGTATLVVFRKIANSEGASWTFTASISVDYGILAVSKSGVDSGTPVDATPTANSGNDTSPIGLSVTTATDNAWLTLFVAANSGSVAITEPSGWNERAEVGGKRNEVSDVEQASAGASGNKTATLGASRAWGTIMYALRPATVAGGQPTSSRRRGSTEPTGARRIGRGW